MIVPSEVEHMLRDLQRQYREGTLSWERLEAILRILRTTGLAIEVRLCDSEPVMDVLLAADALIALMRDDVGVWDADAYAALERYDAARKALERQGADGR